MEGHEYNTLMLKNSNASAKWKASYEKKFADRTKCCRVWSPWCNAAN